MLSTFKPGPPPVLPGHRIVNFFLQAHYHTIFKNMLNYVSDAQGSLPPRLSSRPHIFRLI